MFTVFLEHTELKTICLFHINIDESYKNEAIFHATSVRVKSLNETNAPYKYNRQSIDHMGVANASKGMVFPRVNGKVGDLMNFCPLMKRT